MDKCLYSLMAYGDSLLALQEHSEFTRQQIQQIFMKIMFSQLFPILAKKLQKTMVVPVDHVKLKPDFSTLPSVTNLTTNQLVLLI